MFEMQGMRRDTQKGLARLIAAILVAILSALVGQKQLTKNKNIHPPAGDVSGQGRPVDGDSLFVGGSEVRLKGIDAPEGRQTCMRNGSAWDCGNAARDELRRLIGGQTVVCQSTERDMHGRLLGYCTAGGRDLNSGMVAAGLAVAYGGYLREQGQAKAAKRGLWAGEFQQPRDWRHERGIGL